MDGEGEDLGRAAEGFLDRVSSSEPAQRPAFPHRVLHEQGRYSIWVVIVIAEPSVSGLQALNGVGVF